MAFISVLLQIFWQKFYWNVLGVVLYQPYEFCPNCWFWLVAAATERLNFRTKYSKIFFSEAIRWIKLKLCINVYDISLYISCGFYCCCSCVFRCYGNFKFPQVYNGKSESRPLFLSDYRYFDISFTVMFVEHIKSKLLNLISSMANERLFLAHLYESTGRAIAVSTVLALAFALLKVLKFLVKVFKSLYLLNPWMHLVDTLPDVRYWSEVMLYHHDQHQWPWGQGHGLWNF